MVGRRLFCLVVLVVLACCAVAAAQQKILRESMGKARAQRLIGGDEQDRSHVLIRSAVPTGTGNSIVNVLPDRPTLFRELTRA